MHVGFLSPEYLLPGKLDGGLANYLHKTGQALVQRGQQVSVFTLSDRNAAWKDGQVQVYEIQAVRFPAGLRGSQYHNWMRQLINAGRIRRSVWRAHSQQPLNILQASSYLAPGFALLNNPHIPVVCRISSYTPLLRAAQQRQKTFGDQLSDWLETRQIVDAQATFSPSQWVASLVQRLEACQVSVIRTPLEDPPPVLDPSIYLKRFEGMKYLLFFGTLNLIKGVDILADALPEVLSRHPDLNMVLIGRDETYRGQPMSELVLSRNEKYSSRIHHLDPLSKQQLVPIISHASGVIIPSRVDNYPNVCLEALGQGVPVVGSQPFNLEEIILNGENGFLSQNGDAASLAQAILRLVDCNQDELARMRQSIETTISAIQHEDRIGRLLAFYENVCAQFSASTSQRNHPLL